MVRRTVQSQSLQWRGSLLLSWPSQALWLPWSLFSNRRATSRLCGGASRQCPARARDYSTIASEPHYQGVLDRHLHTNSPAVALEAVSNEYAFNLTHRFEVSSTNQASKAMVILRGAMTRMMRKAIIHQMRPRAKFVVVN